MAVRGPRGRLRHRRGRGALTSRGVAPPDLRAAPHRQTSVRHPTARPPCGARPARPLAVRAASFARRVVSKPGQAQQASHRPPVGRPLPPGPAATHRHRSHLHPIRPRAALQPGGYYHLTLPPPTGTAATSSPQASHRPPVGRLLPPGPAATHRHRSHLHPIRPRTHPFGHQWGFCSIRSSVPACRRRVGILMALFPPLHVTWAAGQDRQHSPSAPPHDNHHLSPT